MVPKQKDRREYLFKCNFFLRSVTNFFKGFCLENESDNDTTANTEGTAIDMVGFWDGDILINC